ncbi:MAG: helix-turn-helix domain-containing protein [Gemmatimonadota bacterium]
MQMVHRPVLVMHGDPGLWEAIGGIRDSRYKVRAVPEWRALSDAIREASPAALVVVDPYLGMPRGAGPAPQLQALLRDFPSITVFIAVPLDAEVRSDLHLLARWGVSQVVTLGYDNTPAALEARFEAELAGPLKAVLEDALPPAISGRARYTILLAAEIAAVGGQAEGLAERLGIGRRALGNLCKALGIPPARELFAWMRILLAASLLDDPGRSIESIAPACGYSADSGLRRVMQNYLGASPRQLRREGALRVAVGKWLEELERYRRGEGQQAEAESGGAGAMAGGSGLREARPAGGS